MDLTDVADDTGLDRNFSDESEVSVPDLSSRARSLAILRDIFGETVGSDALDVARVRAQELPAGADDKVTLRRPTAEASGAELSAPDVSASEEAGTNAAAAGLPGVSEEESRRYRRQMYRTDI